MRSVKGTRASHQSPAEPHSGPDKNGKWALRCRSGEAKQGSEDGDSWWPGSTGTGHPGDSLRRREVKSLA